MLVRRQGSELTVGKRLVIIPIVCLSALAGYALISQLTLAATSVGSDRYREVILDNELVADVLPPPEYLVETNMVALSMLASARQGDTAAVQESAAKVADLQASYETRHEYWTEQLAPGEIRDTLLESSYEPAQAYFALLDEQYLPALVEGRIADADAVVTGPMQEQYRAHREAIDRVVELVTARAKVTETDAKAFVSSRTRLLVAVAAFGVVVAVIATFLTSRSLMRRLRETVGAIDEASSGLGSVATQLASSSQETSSQAGVVSAAAEEVSSTVRTVADAVEELSASVRQVAINTESVTKVARDGVGAVAAGRETMVAMSDASREITEVVEAISAISEQTHLLALNATIEAARAGDAGKGFAVVAGEVNALATQASTATARIADRLAQLVAAGEAAVQAFDRVGRMVDEIADLQAEIATATNQQHATTAELARAAAEAAQGTEEIAQNVTYIADAAEQSAGGAGEAEQAATHLAGVAEGLGTLVGRT